MHSSLLFLLPLLLLLLPSLHSAAPIDISPQQIHLALGYEPTTFLLNYVTPSLPLTSTVSYGLSPSQLNVSLKADFHVFTDGGSLHTNRTMHAVTLPSLVPATRYHYRVTTGNSSGEYHSPVLSFRTVATNVGKAGGEALRIGLLGDWGWVNGTQTHHSLERLVDRQALDLLVHVGDISYNLDRNQGEVGDQFMRREQSVVGRLPYQVAPGNHEGNYNFSHYLERFSMPHSASGSSSPMYYSFNVGSVHFISFDAERYFTPDFAATRRPTMDDVRVQFEWLQADLEKAVRNRAEQPWIVAFGHRPMYCTHIHNDWMQQWCTEDAAAVRDGVAFRGGARMYGLEALFHNYSVDMYASGHMHSYERTYPVYREQVVNRDYRDNAALWHLIVGASGCQGPMDQFDEGQVYPWSAARSDSYGYGVLEVHNATHMHWAQILDEDESVMDELWVVKREQPEKGEAVTTKKSEEPAKRGKSSAVDMPRA